MSVKSSTNRFPIDSLLQFDVAGAGSSVVTATGASAASIPLDVQAAYWNTGDVAELIDFMAVVEVTAVSGTTPTLDIKAQVSADAAFSSPAAVTVAELPALTAVGRYQVSINREEIIRGLGAAHTTGFLRLLYTLGGTTPSFTLFSYASPLVG